MGIFYGDTAVCEADFISGEEISVVMYETYKKAAELNQLRKDTVYMTINDPFQSIEQYIPGIENILNNAVTAYMDQLKNNFFNEITSFVYENYPIYPNVSKDPLSSINFDYNSTTINKYFAKNSKQSIVINGSNKQGEGYSLLTAPENGWIRFLAQIGSSNKFDLHLIKNQNAEEGSITENDLSPVIQHIHDIVKADQTYNADTVFWFPLKKDQRVILNATASTLALSNIIKINIQFYSS